MQTLTPQSSIPLYRRARTHALAPGSWVGSDGVTSITWAVLQSIVDSYDPNIHEAPVVLGHPVTDDPAYGWVRSVVMHPDGLWVESDLVPEMADLYERGHYKKVSVSLYTPDAPANPVPGSYYLKHLGFLGAVPPAVKGLAGTVLYSDDDQTLTLNFSVKEIQMSEKTAPAPKTPTAAPGSVEVDLDEKQQAISLAESELVAKRKEIELAEQKVAARERALRREQWTTKLDVHVNAGRLLPKDKPLLLELMERTHGQTVDLSEDQKGVSLETRLEEFLSGLPAQIELSEVSGVDKAAPPPAAVSFSAPAGHDVDAARLELHNRAMEYLKENPGHLYTEAIRAVGGSNV